MSSFTGLLEELTEDEWVAMLAAMTRIGVADEASTTVKAFISLTTGITQFSVLVTPEVLTECFVHV